ncbi:glycosyltransferase 87 family protein [Streptomyces sp. V4-01]|uniref:Glycosyltransferase 87 family protein n=1 Tax=Actinacidiphila polyblastidii TaxID=3110430 RepID=A0ABU7P742_9ACTN|nr:glycosyltransferase 87 family protein [Streptomyces sp. V4-01]
MTSPPIGRSGRALAVWVVTRAGILLFVFKVFRFPQQVILNDVSHVYLPWFEVLRHGAFPAHDVTWQYPPGAAAVMAAPAAVPLVSYTTGFFALAFLADALVLAALLYDARRAARMPGVWVWVAGVALLGPLVYARYDVLVTAVAVAALLALPRRPALGGALAAAGALLKVWPVLLLIGTPPGRATRRAWTAAAGAAAALTALFALTMSGSLSFLTMQADRGTEVESLGAMVFHLGRHLGWQGRVRMHYGSMEFLGPHVHLVSAAALTLSLLALCWLLWWRLRARTYSAATPYDAAFTALLVFTTTSRVISPQYMVWLIGAGAVCMTVRGSSQRLPVLLMLAATLFTTLEFPLFFNHVTASDAWGVLLIGVRNALLVGASLVACRRLWTSTVPVRAAGGVRGGGALPETSSVLTSR